MELHDRRLGENLRRIRLNAHLTQKRPARSSVIRLPSIGAALNRESGTFPCTRWTGFAAL